MRAETKHCELADRKVSALMQPHSANSMRRDRGCVTGDHVEERHLERRMRGHVAGERETRHDQRGGGRADRDARHRRVQRVAQVLGEPAVDGALQRPGHAGEHACGQYKQPRCLRHRVAPCGLGIKLHQQAAGNRKQHARRAQHGERTHGSAGEANMIDQRSCEQLAGACGHKEHSAADDGRQDSCHCGEDDAKQPARKVPKIKWLGLHEGCAGSFRRHGLWPSIRIEKEIARYTA
eukprot:1853603-Pleurochrysis_carterae.AAC.2